METGKREGNLACPGLSTGFPQIVGHVGTVTIMVNVLLMEPESFVLVISVETCIPSPNSSRSAVSPSVLGYDLADGNPRSR